MAYNCLKVDREQHCGIITLDRPKVNALSLSLIGEMLAAVEDLEQDTSVRCILLTGKGRCFCGGADVATIQAMRSDPFVTGGMLSEGVKMMNAIESCSKPVVAAINGAAMGGGCELALACHLRIAADEATFGLPEITLGIIPGWGGTFRLPRLIGEARAAEWLLTGRAFGPQEAWRAGLVCKVVPGAELLGAAREYGAMLAKQPVVATRMVLSTLTERAHDTPRGMAVEADAFAEAIASKDAAEGMAAFVEKRKPDFEGE